MLATHRLHMVLAVFSSVTLISPVAHSGLYVLGYRSKEPLQDNVIATYEEHEDSVYAVDWASADPWLFASLSYDGRLVINRVPRALKYHILL
jgi:WD40 repeat protein